MLLILNELPDQAEAIERAVSNGSSRQEVEQALLGFNHADVGAELAHRWKFPALFIEAFKAYPAPTEQAEFLALAGTFHLADYLARKALEGAPIAQIQSELPESVLSQLGLDRHELIADLPSVSDVTAGLDNLLG